MMTNAEFEHQGKRYRIISRTLNFLSMKQDVTLLVNGIELGRKTDPLYASLSFKQKLHAMFGLVAFGVLIGMASAILLGG